MMEVQQRLACLSPTQRLSVHSQAALRQLPTSPLSLPLSGPEKPSLPSTMIIEASLHPSTTTPPDSPQQAETVPSSVSENVQTNFTMSKELQEEKSFSQELQQDQEENQSLTWVPNSDLASGVEEFSPCGMAREGVEDGSASPGQQSPMEKEGASSHDMSANLQGPDNCYTPPILAAPSTPGSQEFGDRRNRRKQTIEDIVRRIVTSEPEDHYNSEEMEDEMDPQLELQAIHGNSFSDDEVDGAPVEISRHILNAQACAESAIKQSLQRSFEDGDHMEPEGDRPEMYTPENFLHLRKDFEDPKFNFDRRWEDFKMIAPEAEHRGEMGEKKSGVTILPKTPLPPFSSPSMAGGLHSSLPMSNISETAYSPHHFSSAKMNNGWFPGAMPHLFPFSPAGLMDSPLGPKFLPFEGKLMEMDKDYLKCSYCERTFRRQKNLENHIENTHNGKGGQRPKRENGDMYFKCSHCPYTTKHQSNLYVHLRIHTGERPYICGACGVQYSQSHSLKSHIINKHEGHMNYYIKEKRNRSPRGLGYMSTHVNPGDQTIFKIPPPPVVPNMQHSNMEIVARAIEMAKNSLGEGHSHPPPLLHHQHGAPPMHHNSPMMSPNGHVGHHGLFPKAGPGFPFSGHFPPAMPFSDLPATPTPAMMAQPSANSHHPNGISTLSPSTSSSGSSSNSRQELLNLSMSCLSTPTTSTGPGYSSGANPPSLLSPVASARPLPTPTTPVNSNKGTEGGPDCAPMDLSTRGGWQDGKMSACSAKGDGSPCSNCLHGNKLKLLRLNVVRMLSILVPNLNFEEKGINADSDSVDELLQDVIESNTHDDDMVH